ncbi:MAG: type II toxin-antitoxin system RelE/ParE family toxin, partial [Deltaproteobacteria bacterium]|nr:type II toxin-antitoxin system RelE/ParE family toxin [Deltaproteobacteria bacterium]
MGKAAIKFTPEAARLFALLPPENKKMIKEGIKVLAQAPDSGGDLQEELSGFKSYKLKRYRIIYKFLEEDNTIRIYYVGHRRDVYEQFHT